MTSVVAALSLGLLGGFAARVRAEPASLPTRKTEALLAYLAMARGEPVRRDALARLLWGTQDFEHARNNLRQALTGLRRALGPGTEAALDAGRDTVALDPSAAETDVEAFERLAASGDLRRAAELYRGEFMEGFDALHAPAFEEWRAREAARLRGLAVAALLALLGREDGTGGEPGHGEDVWVARRLLELDPLQEAAHRSLMRHYAALGQPALALAQYETCRDLLAARLGAAPTPQTEALRDALASRCTAPVEVAAPEGVPAAVSAASSPPQGLAPPADRPSLAVLPFANLSGGPEQDYFADGMVEDLTAALSRIRSFLVIARNSAFTYKGRAVDVRRVGRELGVRYVLEGSVRKAGGRIRITCQLIDTATGAHLWADRFDGEASEVFELQDRVTEAVAGAIEPSLRRAEIQRARAKPTASLDAYDLYLRALAHSAVVSRRDNDAALEMLRGAIAHDPGYAAAKALAAFCHQVRYLQDWLGPGEREEGIRMARAALATAGDDPTALALAGRALGFLAQDRDQALLAVERALALNPNSALVRSSAGWVYVYLGKPAEALGHLRHAARLSPLDPEMSYFLSGIAYAHLMARRYEEALAAGLAAVREQPGRGTSHRAVVAALACLGRGAEAEAEAERYRDLAPTACRVFPDRVQALFADQEFARTMIRCLREAGLPE